MRAAVVLALLLGACRHDPPAPTSTPTSTATATATSTPTSSAPSASSPVPLPPPQAGEGGEEPALLGADGKLLPQTEDHPSVESPVFRKHLELLVEAIVKDDVEIARAAFFPQKAYEAVKTIKDPGKDWEHRLFRAFKRNIHEYHGKLGKHAEGTKLERLELPDAKAKWMKPHSEGNGIGYWRVLRSKLHLVDGAGKKREFEVSSFISWRGEWYVVHLHGFK